MFEAETIANCHYSVNSNLHIPSSVGLLSNSVMEAKDIRRINMQALAIQHKTLEALAEKVGSSASSLSQIRNRIRNMGGPLARRFERKLGLAHGWMDNLHTAEEPKTQAVYKAPTEELEQIFKAYDELRPELKKQALANLKSMVRASKEIERHTGTTQRFDNEEVAALRTQLKERKL